MGPPPCRQAGPADASTLPAFGLLAPPNRLADCVGLHRIPPVGGAFGAHRTSRQGLNGAQRWCTSFMTAPSLLELPLDDELLKVLASDTRRDILRLLLERRMTGTELATRLDLGKP